ncbi:hypothetical protein [Flavobacterium cyclinae]|uniref:hypothetical protein n=1 Tax=Flavobacterium cyclinae TaxID=2895947 RepID=UPI001E339786|nr:hypothetical protein [Flavobacterium cyclinae]UGS22308.1 hypothetical protein LOS86_06710 [Flavobacterium cyclinae]
MEILKIQIFKIDIDEEEVSNIDSKTYGEELDNYLLELFETIISGSSGRQFKFERKTTEVRSQITNINNGQDFNNCSKVISERLLKVEVDAQKKMDKLKVTIQKGIFVQAQISEDKNNKFIICKADHNEFLNEVDFTLSKGLPTKKKAFKAFVCDLNDDDSDSGILVYDTNPSDTKYWWKELLELEMIITDEDNTENAFGAIDNVITKNIKEKYPQDYTHIRNSVVRYFRATERFEMQHFLDNAIGNYLPENHDLDVDGIKSKIKELPAKKRAPFDNQFNIIKEKVKAKFLNKIKLTPEIDLNIKGDYADNTIIAEIKDGEKYISIKSEEGYKYFKKN